MGITTKSLTFVLKAFVFGALVASIGLSTAHAKDLRKNHVVRALRMDLWYLGVYGKFQSPVERVMDEKRPEKVDKQPAAYPEELTRALEKANF